MAGGAQWPIPSETEMELQNVVEELREQREAYQQDHDLLLTIPGKLDLLLHRANEAAAQDGKNESRTDKLEERIRRLEFWGAAAFGALTVLQVLVHLADKIWK